MDLGLYVSHPGKRLKIMRGKLKQKGTYELFNTVNNHEILCLNNSEWYALVNGQKGDIIVLTDSDHVKTNNVQKGKFYFADFEDDPEFSDLPHLFLEKDTTYRELVLPNGLPTPKDHQKRVIRLSTTLPAELVHEHVLGKGDRGTEKQYQGRPEHLRSKTKKQLYRQARKSHIKGRSKMNKEELVQRLKE